MTQIACFMYYLQNQILFEHFFPGTSIFLLQCVVFIYIVGLYRTLLLIDKLVSSVETKNIIKNKENMNTTPTLQSPLSYSTMWYTLLHVIRVWLYRMGSSFETCIIFCRTGNWQYGHVGSYLWKFVSQMCISTGVPVYFFSEWKVIGIQINFLSSHLFCHKSALH